MEVLLRTFARKINLLRLLNIVKICWFVFYSVRTKVGGNCVKWLLFTHRVGQMVWKDVLGCFLQRLSNRSIDLN